MATTTNFGWETPDDTDLVKDGAAAIRTALGGVDTSFVDLKGGTTGQVLSKASNTDLDYSWIAVDPLTILDAKGDLISATAADTPARLAVGTNGQVLTADSTAATGIKWATASAARSLTLLNAGGTALTGSASTTISFSADYDELYIYVTRASMVTSGANYNFTFNGDSGSNYFYAGFGNNGGLAVSIPASDAYWRGGTLGADAANLFSASLSIQGARGTSAKAIESVSAGNGTSAVYYTLRGYYSGSSGISSVTIASDGANFDAGTIYVYGA
jgi:hypothetical protein